MPLRRQIEIGTSCARPMIQHVDGRGSFSRCALQDLCSARLARAACNSIGYLDKEACCRVRALSLSAWASFPQNPGRTLGALNLAATTPSLRIIVSPAMRRRRRRRRPLPPPHIYLAAALEWEREIEKRNFNPPREERVVSSRERARVLAEKQKSICMYARAHIYNPQDGCL